MLVQGIRVDVAFQIYLLRDLTELRYVTLKGGVSKFVKLAREVAQQLYLIRLLNGHGKLLGGLIQS